MAYGCRLTAVRYKTVKCGWHMVRVFVDFMFGDSYDFVAYRNPNKPGKSMKTGYRNARTLCVREPSRVPMMGR